MDAEAPSGTVPLTNDSERSASQHVGRRRPWQTWVEIVLCSGYPTQFLIAQVLLAGGVRATRPDGSLSSTFVFALSLVDTVILLSLIAFLLRRRGERPRQVLFGNLPPARDAGAGVLSLPLVLFVVIALTIAIRRLAPALHNVPDNPLEGLLASGASLWLFMTVVIVAGGVREELQRAFLLHRFRADLERPWLGLAVTSVAFGMGHTLQGLDAAVMTGVLGAIWGAMFLMRGGALAAMVSHSLFNSTELLRAFAR